MWLRARDAIAKSPPPRTGHLTQNLERTHDPPQPRCGSSPLNTAPVGQPTHRAPSGFGNGTCLSGPLDRPNNRAPSAWLRGRFCQPSRNLSLEHKDVTPSKNAQKDGNRTRWETPDKPKYAIRDHPDSAKNLNEGRAKNQQQIVERGPGGSGPRDRPFNADAAREPRGVGSLAMAYLVSTTAMSSRPRTSRLLSVRRSFSSS